MLREDVVFARAAMGALFSGRSLRDVPTYLLERYAKRPVERKTTNGFTIYLNPRDLTISSSIAELGFWQIGITEVFRRLVSKGTVVVDAGANIGWFSLLAWRLGGTVKAFEPEPEAFALLAKSLELNGTSGVEAHQMALSDLDGDMTLFLSDTENQGAHSLTRLGKTGVTVRSRRLDSLLDSKVDLLKIDTEGAEPLVLSGSRKLLEDEKVVRIVMEWNPEAWTGRRTLLDQLFSMYRVWLIKRSLPYLSMKRIRAEELPSSEANLLLELD